MNQQKKEVLILAATTGYQTRAFAEAAERLGLGVTLATDRCHILDDPWADQAIPVRFHDPVGYAGVLADRGRSRGWDGVVAVGDRPTVLAAFTAEALGLPYNSSSSVEATRNKYLSRERFRAAGLNVPNYFRISSDEDPAEAAVRPSYPCVLKPVGLSASRGVIRANDQAEFVAAFLRITKLLESPDIRAQRDEQNRFIQVEDFIPGREFALEGLITAGRLQVLAIFDKPDPLEGPYFEETIYVTPSREPRNVQDAMIDAATRGICALGLTQGPVHAEFRYNERGAWILEMAARPIGGLCARCLRFTPDTSLEELILRHATGDDVSDAELIGGSSGVMMIPISRAGIYEGVTGVERARAVPSVGDVIITAKEGQKMVPLPEGSSYLGFIFARAGGPAEAESALREAHSCLEFKIATVLPVVRT